MTSKQRAYLKGLAMKMEPIMQLGKGSVTPENTAAVDEALAARELIKISVLQNCLDDPRQMAEVLAERTHSQVVQVIGRKIVLYREGKDNKKGVQRTMETRRKKIGIMGGTFDPIHIGHLILGEKTYEQLGLDKILFMPAGNPPHKQNRIGRATDAQRVSMVEKAISGNPHFELSLIEMNDKGFTYTYHTLETLKEQNPDTDYYFIIGADSLYDFSSWREPARICKACTIVVAVRDHVPVEKLNEQMTYLSERYNGRFISLNTLNIDISSQLLRKWHQEGKSLRYYVPDAVADYIDKNHIYHITEGVGHNNV